MSDSHQLNLDDLRGVQRALAMLGHDPGVFDGLPGPRTTSAITEFQAAAGLDADGKYGPRTRGALQQAVHQAFSDRGISARPRGEHRKFGDDQAWPDTRAACGHAGRLYVAYGNGKLFGIEPLAGRWSQIGSADGWRTRLMFGLGRELGLVEASGALWLVHPGTGEFRKHGDDNEWEHIVAGGAYDHGVQCYSSLGSLWHFTVDGGWRQIGSLATWKSRILVPGPALLTVEESGEAFRIDSRTGDFRSLGHGLAEAKSAVRVGDEVVACVGDGRLVTVNLEDGSLSPLSASGGWTAKFLVSPANHDLVSVEANGNLFEISI